MAIHTSPKPTTSTAHPRALLAALSLLLLVSCGGVDLTTVADTQYLLTTRALPLTSILVVCDTRDLGFKSDMEAELTHYFKKQIGISAYRDIDLYSPLKTLSEKEKLWALKDAGIQAVLYLNAGGSGRSLRDWLYPEAADVDVSTQAWQSSCVRMFAPESGLVVWVGGLPGEEQKVSTDLLRQSFYSAIAGDLLKRGILAIAVEDQPLIRGFNR